MEVLKNTFQKHGVSLAYVFGSQQKGLVGPLSDVDIAVLFNPAKTNYSIPDLLSLTSELETFYPQKKVDLTILNNASPLLKKEAALKGETIFSSLKPVQQFAFEKKVLEEYEDTKRLREIYYQYLTHHE